MGSLENKVTPTLSVSEDDKACLQAILVSSAQIFSCVLNAAIELDLFGIIARAGPAACITTSEIASQLPTKDSDSDTSSRLDRMLRVLVSHSLLTCSIHTPEDGRVERLYGLTPTSYFFVEKDDGSSLASLPAFISHRAFCEARYTRVSLILYKCKSVLQKRAVTFHHN